LSMKNINMTLRTIAVLIMATMFLSCSGDKSVSGQITLNWWQFWTDQTIKPTIESMVAEFEKANPNIKVKLSDMTWANGHEKIVIAFSSGTAPDIVELGSDWVPEFSSSGQLASLDQYLANDTALYHGWQSATWDGSIYAVPWILGTRVIYINRTLMMEAGFGQNYAPANWPQLKELCYAIDSLGKDIYGFGSNAAEKHRLYKKWMPFFWSHDGRIISKDGKYSVISSDKAYNALVFYKDLNDSCSMIDTQRRLEDAFLDGKIGVIMSGDWLLKRIDNEKRDIDFLTSTIPGPIYPGKSFMGGEYLAVSEKSENKEAAYKFIRFITSKANQLKFCKANYSMNPSNKEAAKDPFFNDDINRKAFTIQLRSSQAPPAIPEWVEIEDIIETTLEDVLFNNVPPAKALYSAKQKIGLKLNLK